MDGWHHWLNGHKFEQTQGDSEGQGSLLQFVGSQSQTRLSNWKRKTLEYTVGGLREGEEWRNIFKSNDRTFSRFDKKLYMHISKKFNKEDNEEKNPKAHSYSDCWKLVIKSKSLKQPEKTTHCVEEI